MPEQFESTPQKYIEIAKRMIKTFAPNYTAKRMLRSEDAISYVAFHIMKADWKWDANRGRTRNSYRNQCGIWSIKLYNYMIAKEPYIISLNRLVGDTPLYELIPDRKTKTPLAYILQQEEAQELVDAMEFLSQREKDILEAYYVDRQSYRNIGQKQNLTYERVSQIKKRAEQKICNELKIKL